jgi:dihydrofolate reductase
VHKDFEADTFFPEISEKKWELTSSENIDDDNQNDFKYTFEIYDKR